MAFFVPLLVAGGLGANWYAAKELEDVSSLERVRRPISDFWSGALLGAILGLWVGIHHGETLKSAWNTIDRVSAWIFPAVVGQKRQVDPPAQGGAPQYYNGGPPGGQVYQAPPPAPGSQPVVYYHAPYPLPPQA